MVGALKKWLLSQADNVGQLEGMGLPEMLGLGARKAGSALGEGIEAVKAQPKFAGIAGGLGGGVGAALASASGQDDIEDEELEELRKLKAMGL